MFIQVFSYSHSWEIYLSVLTSIALFLGCSFLGRSFFKGFLNKMLDNKHAHFMHYPLLGNIALNFFIQIALLFSIQMKTLIFIIGLICCLLGMTYLILMIRRWRYFFSSLKNWIKADRIYHSMMLTLLIGFFLLSLSPITNADALDYHLGVPGWILKNNALIFQKTWFHQSLTGLGENSVLLSIIMKAEQFSTIIQFSGLLSITGIFYSFKPLNSKFESNNRILLVLIFLTTPVLLFLASGPKPQLSAIAISCFLFAIISSEKIKMVENKISHILILFILLVYMPLVKLNFGISSFILFLIFLWSHHKRSMLSLRNVMLMSVCLIFALIFFSPFFYLNYTVRHHEIKNLLIASSSLQPGFENFIAYLKSYKDIQLKFPLDLFIPEHIGEYSMIIGLNFIVTIYLILNSTFKKYHLLFFICIEVLLLIFLSQHSGRFIFEPMLWILIWIFIFGDIQQKKTKKLVKVCAALFIIQISSLLFGISTLTRGILSTSQREIVMSNSAFGYSVAKWVNHKIPADKKILNSIRSTSLFNQKVYKTEWMRFTKDKADENSYVSYLSHQNIDYIVFTANTPEKSILFKFCGKFVAGPFEWVKEARNPINRGISNKVWIYTANIKE